MQQGRNGEDVEVADAVVVRQAALGAHAEAASDGLAVANGTKRGAAAEVAGDDLDVLATEELGGAAGDVAVAGAVEAPAADAVLGGPLVGHGVALVGFGDGAVKTCLERRHKWDLGEAVGEGPHRGDVGRVVGGSDGVVLLHRVEHGGINAMDARQGPSMHGLEADGGDLIRRRRSRRCRGW